MYALMWEKKGLQMLGMIHVLFDNKLGPIGDHHTGWKIGGN